MQNFVFSVPNTAKSLEALDALELIVSVDTHMSETRFMADYVIPAPRIWSATSSCRSG